MGPGPGLGTPEERRAAQLGTERLPGGAAPPAEPGAAWDLLSSGVSLCPGGPHWSSSFRSKRALHAGLARATCDHGVTVHFPAGPQPLRQLRAVLSRREQICHGQCRWPGEGWGRGWAGGPCREGAPPIVLCCSEHTGLPSRSPCGTHVSPSSSPRHQARSLRFTAAQGTRLRLPAFKRRSELSPRALSAE